jgi:ABC-type transport system involved in multi-copper enzyme maturation permease subunit
MVGPILHQEMLLGSRRNKLYIFRWIYAGWLIVQVLWFAWVWLWGSIGPWAHIEEPLTAYVSTHFLHVFVSQQLALVFLVTPVFVAGAISDEKTRGTLQYLLTTDLASWHILVGKLLARVAQVAMIALAGLPLLCFVGVVGGLEPLTLVVLFLVTALPLFAIGSATLLATVWTRKTLEAVLVLMPILLPASLAILFSDLIIGGNYPTVLDGRYVMEPAWGRTDLAGLRELGRRLFTAALCWGGVGTVCLALAVWRMRPAYLRQLHTSGSKRKLHWWNVGRTAISDSPVRWKEYHVEGLAPLPVLRQVPRWLGVAGVFLLGLLSSLIILWFNLLPQIGVRQLIERIARFDGPGLLNCFADAGFEFHILGLVALFLSTLLVGIRCSGSVSGEREKLTWEALLLSPLSVKHLIRGKLWGILGATYIYLLAYAIPVVTLAVLGGWRAISWTLLLLFVTIMASYFKGAAGLRCSVRATTSWRSLLGTLAIGYLGGTLVFLITSPVFFILAGIMAAVIGAFDNYFHTNLAPGAAGALAFYWPCFEIAAWIGLALCFWGLAVFFLNDAQRWVADRERTRHWKEEPMSYRPRRRRPRLRSASY